MKKAIIKKVVAAVLIGTMAIGCLTGCGAPKETKDSEQTQTSKKESKGTIMWLAASEDKPGRAHMEALCEKFGYKSLIVYGDSFNDAAGNLSAVKNSMNSDVVGLITSLDGGISNIMEEYPDLYVCGYNSEMNSVYGEGGENASILENDHYLGTNADGYADGADTAKVFFDKVVENGYQKISLVNFPSYAYPGQAVMEAAFRDLVDEYNKTAAKDQQINIVGDTTTLEFTSLADSWFLEDGHDELDAIVGFCAGIDFIYPTLVTAKANGTCSPDTKLLTSGFSEDHSFLDDFGEDGNLAFLALGAPTYHAYSMVLLDNAVSGKQYSDWTNDRLDAVLYMIDSAEDAKLVKEKAILCTYNAADAPITPDMAYDLCLENNPDATYEELVTVMTDPVIISVDALKE